MPLDAEERLEKFSELVATAIANADSRSELAPSRRRIVAASDEARRRIERDLHDGTQQRLVPLGLAVRAAEADVPPDRATFKASCPASPRDWPMRSRSCRSSRVGSTPRSFPRGGLGPALRTLARRSAIPVELDITADTRLPEPIEVAAYHVASEALANATKHAQASRVDVSWQRATAACSYRSATTASAGPTRRAAPG
jgi:signal transduction histidine kinase